MARKTHQRSPWGIVNRQHGVISRSQLLASGYSREAIQHRIDAGRLHPVHRGVYAVGRPELTRDGEFIAAVLACGDTAVLSHDSAAALWGIAKHRRALVSVHVSVLDAGRSRDGIAVHRRTALKTTRHRCIPTTTPAQTLIDLAPRWPQPDLEQAIGEADLRRLVRLGALRRAASEAGRSSAALRRLIDNVTFRVTQSELERELLRLLLRARLPLPETQERFGRHRVDFYWPDLGLVVETDGGNFHRTPQQQRRDRERDQDHIRCGRTPMRLTHGQVFDDAADTIALLVAVVQRLAEDHDRAGKTTRAARTGARTAA